MSTGSVRHLQWVHCMVAPYHFMEILSLKHVFLHGVYLCQTESSWFSKKDPQSQHWSPQLNCCLCRCLLEPSSSCCWWLVCCVWRCVSASLTAHWRSLVETWCPFIHPLSPPPTPRHLHCPPLVPRSGQVEWSQVGFFSLSTLFTAMLNIFKNQDQLIVSSQWLWRCRVGPL